MGSHPILDDAFGTPVGFSAVSPSMVVPAENGELFEILWLHPFGVFLEYFRFRIEWFYLLTIGLV